MNLICNEFMVVYNSQTVSTVCKSSCNVAIGQNKPR